MKLKDEKGLTLVELVLSITLIGVIGIASFAGFQYAFITMSSADEFSEELYVSQENLENHMRYSYSAQLSQAYTDDELDILLGVPDTDVIMLSIDYNWDNSLFVAGVPDLNDFESVGVSVKEDVIGGSYLDKDSYTYLPLYTHIP